VERELLESILRNIIREELSNLLEEEMGLWDRIRQRRAKGLPRKKPGQTGYPDPKTWKKLTKKK